MARLGTARLPAGLRLYAIGDVHGERAALRDMHARVAADLAARPVADWRILHVGDLIDRGPDSAGVLADLAAADPERVQSVRGNHDAFLLDFLAKPEGRALELWFMNGGEAAVASFGIDPWDALRSGAERGRTRLRDALASAMPVASRAFMEAMPLTLRFGDFLFVHAGIRPGVALEAQDADDLIWIRGAFLEDDTEHPAVIVHGHTPTRFVELRPNRIGIDTGAGKGGPLSAIIIEGSSVALLSKNGPVPLPPPG